jgi:hypothetical protein
MACVIPVFIVVNVNGVSFVVLRLLFSGQQNCSMLFGVCVTCVRRVSILHVQVS